MRKLVIVLGLVALAATGPPARAEIGTPDVVPAATLLLPYFEVDLSDPSGATTLFSVNNASDDAVLAFVTVWSEWWVPVLGFNVYLTGYDVHTINLRDIVNGDLPNTGPSNTLSIRGSFSSPHSTFGGSCAISAGSAPNYENLSAAFVQVIQQSLSGQPRTTDGLCAAAPGRPTLARGFVTVDTVRACADQFPDHASYFVDGGLGTATNQNVLWGDYFLVDPGRNLAQGFTLVHLEAHGDSLGQGDNACSVGGGSPTTFYCALRNPVGQAGEDNREALPSVYATRYLRAGYDGGVFPLGGRERGPGAVSGVPGGLSHADLPPAGAGRPRVAAGVGVEGTDLLVWRGKGGPAGAGVPRACDDPPTPLGQNQIVAFDEEENPLAQAPGSEERPFPFGTNRARVGTDLTVGADFGWLFLNLNGGDPAQAPRRQAFVATVITAEGRFGLGYEAIALNTLTRGPGGAATSRDNRRGARNADPTLGPPPNLDTPTLFGP